MKIIINNNIKGEIKYTFKNIKVFIYEITYDYYFIVYNAFF